jgi:hypothetical protein
VNSRRLRVPTLTAMAMGLVIVLAGCTAATPTPIYIQLTPTPAPVTPVPTASPTPAPTDTPTPVPSESAAAPTDTPAVTAAPTDTPASAATPSGGPAAGCSGKVSNQPFWVETANNVPFTVYCAVVPSPWYFSGASSTYGASGTVTATYQTTGGGKIEIKEGAFCTSGASACSPHDSVVGSAHFGDLTGSLDAVGSGFAIYVSPGTSHGYTATGTGVGQSAFVNIVAALIKVPKS